MIDITNTRIHKTATMFDDVRCVNCVISEGCIIGDFCDLVDVKLGCMTELGRRNLIRKSSIDQGTYTGTNTIIKNAEIGKYCCISWNVSIGGGSHNYANVSMYPPSKFKRVFNIPITNPVIAKRTRIGNDVWIGAGANIVSGIAIGDGSVIGAGSVVTHDVEPYSIVAGVPAREIKKRFSKEIIDMLERIKWWNWDSQTVYKYSSFLQNEPSVEQLMKILKSEE